MLPFIVSLFTAAAKLKSKGPPPMSTAATGYPEPQYPTSPASPLPASQPAQSAPLLTRRPTDFIDDGYTISHTIAETEEHGRLTFEFRPVSSVDWGRLVEASFAPLDRYYATAIEVLARCVASWSLTNAAGAVVKISPENLLRVNRLFIAKMAEHVVGKSKPDVVGGDVKN